MTLSSNIPFLLLVSDHELLKLQFIETASCSFRRFRPPAMVKLHKSHTYLSKFRVYISKLEYSRNFMVNSIKHSTKYCVQYTLNLCVHELLI